MGDGAKQRDEERLAEIMQARERWRILSTSAAPAALRPTHRKAFCAVL
jgi:hypothetical protein